MNQRGGAASASLVDRSPITDQNLVATTRPERDHPKSLAERMEIMGAGLTACGVREGTGSGRARLASTVWNGGPAVAAC